MVEPGGHPAPLETAAANGGRRELDTEARDANIRSLVRAAVILSVVVGVLMFALRGMLDWMFAGRLKEAEAQAPESATTPGRAQLPLVIEQRMWLRQSEEAELKNYGWVDRKAGIVRIPIERAMDLIAERGVPAGKGSQTEVEINSRKREQDQKESKKKSQP